MSAPALCLSPAIPITESSRRDFANLGLRALGYCFLFSVIFMLEFPRSGTPNILYEKAAFGFRFIDLAIFAVAFAHLVFIACLRSRRCRFHVRSACRD